METQFKWNNELISAKDLIIKDFLPIAKQGLQKANIDEADITKYLSIIERRSGSKNGSQWIVDNSKRVDHNVEQVLSKLFPYIIGKT